MFGAVLAATRSVQSMLAAQSDTAEDSETVVQAIVEALDQHRVVTARAVCTVAVYGVHVDPNDVWLQVGLHNGDDHYLVLHLPHQATAEDALATLQEYDFERSDVVEVISTKLGEPGDAQNTERERADEPGRHDGGRRDDDR